MKVALIPARGGSKRIPRKNIRPFHGKPIIAWSIEAALDSGCFDHVVVSTDDEEIASVARAYGAQTPFKRPASISDDFAPTAAVMKHAVDWYAANRIAVDHCCCIYATAPFVRSASIRSGLNALIDEGTDYAFTVTAFPSPIQRAYRIRDSRLRMIDPSQYLVRSQDLETSYHDAGQFYWGCFDAWAGQRPIPESSTPIVLPQHEVQDIDTLDDWYRAEMMMNAIISISKGIDDGF